jgi:hypothetical protein
MQRAHAYRWRCLAEHYAGATDKPIAQRHLQSAVFLGAGGYNSEKGIITVGAHKDGVSFRVIAPFSLFRAPLFIPYADIRGWGTTWYLDARSTELEFRRAPAVKMVVAEDLAEWIAGFAGQKMSLSDKSPPQGNAGRGWYAFAMVNVGLSVFMIGWLSAYLMWQ